MLGRVLGLRPLEHDLVSIAFVMGVVKGLVAMFRSIGPDALGEICRRRAGDCGDAGARTGAAEARRGERDRLRLIR